MGAMPRTIFALAVLLLLLTASSCKSDKHPLVGTWEGVDTGVGPSKFPGITLIVSSNRTYTATISGAELIGKWEESGDTLVLTPRTVNGLGVNQMQDMGADEMIVPLNLLVSDDRKTMTLLNGWFDVSGDVVFTKG